MAELSLMALVFLAVTVEVLIFLAKDILPTLHGEAQLDASMKKAQGDLQDTGKKAAARQEKLTKALAAVEAMRDETHKMEKEFETKREVAPVLVHTAGLPGKGTRFRATISKEMPAEPDPNQTVIWEKVNFIEAWASDARSAREAAATQYASTNGYIVGEFAAVPPRPGPGRAAAQAGGWKLIMPIDIFLIMCGIVMSGGWLLFALGRLNALWMASGVKAQSLRVALVARAQRMAEEGKRLKQIDEEIKAAEESLAEAKAEKEKKQTALAAVPPPVPDEIEVQAEFPSSRRDRPYVAEMRLTEIAQIERPDLPRHRWFLLWGGDPQAASARARQIMSGTGSYEITGIRRFN